MLSSVEKGFMMLLMAGLAAVLLLLLETYMPTENPSALQPHQGDRVTISQTVIETSPETAGPTVIRPVATSSVPGSLTLPDVINPQQGEVADDGQPFVTWVRSSTSGPTTTTPSPMAVSERTPSHPPTTDTPIPAVTALLPSTTTSATSDQTGAPPRCPPVNELWEADGYPVEDPCTLSEVKQALTWAWTGTDAQRRSAIRNSHLLDEIFLALDEYGRTHNAGLFDPDTRGDWMVAFDDIRWRGGPRYDRAVIAVTYRLVHRDYQDDSRWTDTLVQVEGEWKLSYRRSYCLQADVIMEYIGSDLRCPPDPDPAVNEDEDPDIIREYEQ